MNFYIVDVFAEQSYAGNPLAVVVEANTLSTETMQRIAAEMNFSETTFVNPDAEKNNSYRVRIFTPTKEIDFAGHPILGTAMVVRDYVSNSSEKNVVLNLSVGPIPVTFEITSDEKASRVVSSTEYGAWRTDFARCYRASDWLVAGRY